MAGGAKHRRSGLTKHDLVIKAWQVCPVAVEQVPL
jgi:hypothetical protein